MSGFNMWMGGVRGSWRKGLTVRSRSALRHASGVVLPVSEVDFSRPHIIGADELESMLLWSDAEWNRHVPSSPPPISAVYDAMVDRLGPNRPSPGSDEMKSEFMICHSHQHFLNHGAFGGCLVDAFDVAQIWRFMCESQPVAFIDRLLFTELARTTRYLSKFISCHPQNLALLPNATAGFNTVIQSLCRRHIVRRALVLSVGYRSVRKLLGRMGVDVVEVEIEYPVTHPQCLVEYVRQNVEGVDLVVVDHVTSNTGIPVPIEDMAELCNLHHIPLLIDGAHGLLAQKLALNDMKHQPSYYVGNCHKWFCSPKGAGFLWVRDDRLAGLEPLVVSHGAAAEVRDDGFASTHTWDGCRDYSSILAIGACTRFWNMLGQSECRMYMHKMAWEAAQYLASEWNTNVFLTGKEGTEEGDWARKTPMHNVRLPGQILSSREYEQWADGRRGTPGQVLQDLLFHRYGVEVPVKTLGGSPHVRISAHVYSRMEDYHPLVEAVKKIVDAEGGNG
mmetsp:Transcript_5991/g.16912  ORF Transcript_5991/g.16912 Transcript_5991/m.16912 type:complete len:504 (+) Transcript_5991:65-1576(+)